MNNPKIYWEVNLPIKCTKCGEFFDYLNTDHFSEGGFESLPKACVGKKDFEVECPACENIFLIDIMDGR